MDDNDDMTHCNGALHMPPENICPAVYEIRVKGHLGGEWSDWFDGMNISRNEDGNTVLTGNLADQPALHGVLKKMRDMGIQLISINRVPEREKDNG